MTEYRVTYEIDVEASSPYGAAREAYQIVTDPESMLPVLEVTVPGSCRHIQVDLAAEADRRQLSKTGDFDPI